MKPKASYRCLSSNHHETRHALTAAPPADTCSRFTGHAKNLALSIPPSHRHQPHTAEAHRETWCCAARTSPLPAGRGVLVLSKSFPHLSSSAGQEASHPSVSSRPGLCPLFSPELKTHLVCVLLLVRLEGWFCIFFSLFFYFSFCSKSACDKFLVSHKHHNLPFLRSVGSDPFSTSVGWSCG